MPWNVHQVVSFPPAIQEAHDVVKVAIRVHIAHFLADHPASRIGQIIDAIGSERATVRMHLAALEELGVVTASLPPGERQGEWVRYSLDRTRWTELVIRIITYLPAAP